MSITSIRLDIYSRRVRESDRCVLDYHRRTNRLKSWIYPSEFTGRIPPSELNVYRDTHQILLPCCLCPLADPHAPDHVESAIYEAREGEFKGKWVASCASESCAYIVPIEKLYSKLGLKIGLYPPREIGEPVPPRIVHLSERRILQARGHPMQLRPLKRTYAQMNICESGASSASKLVPGKTRIPLRKGDKGRQGNAKHDGELFEQLDARVKPGIPSGQFKQLFNECECGLIMTRGAFNRHECLDVVDLTVDE